MSESSDARPSPPLPLPLRISVALSQRRHVEVSGLLEIVEAWSDTQRCAAVLLVLLERFAELKERARIRQAHGNCEPEGFEDDVTSVETHVRRLMHSAERTGTKLSRRLVALCAQCDVATLSAAVKVNGGCLEDPVLTDTSDSVVFSAAEVAASDVVEELIARVSSDRLWHVLVSNRRSGSGESLLHCVLNCRGARSWLKCIRSDLAVRLCARLPAERLGECLRCVNRAGVSVFMRAAMAGASFLLQVTDAPLALAPQTRALNGDTALSLGCEYGSVDCVRLLLERHHAWSSQLRLQALCAALYRVKSEATLSEIVSALLDCDAHADDPFLTTITAEHHVLGAPFGSSAIPNNPVLCAISHPPVLLSALRRLLSEPWIHVCMRCSGSACPGGCVLERAITARDNEPEVALTLIRRSIEMGAFSGCLPTLFAAATRASPHVLRELLGYYNIEQRSNAAVSAAHAFRHENVHELLASGIDESRLAGYDVTSRPSDDDF